MFLTSVSWLTTLLITASVIPSASSSCRVYAPIGTPRSPITTFTPERRRSYAEVMCAGFDFGTSTINLFVANVIGFETSPSW